MASQCPSLPGAFAILSAAGEQRLLRLQHKLQSLRPGCPRADLLLLMVQLQLGQDTAARSSLEVLKADAVAQLVASHWAGTDAGVPAPSEPPDLPWAVAQLYHLLAEEELCPGAMRDSAYQAALQTLSARADPRLRVLQEEAREHCGWDLATDAEPFQSLHSGLDQPPLSSASPPSRTRSQPLPIKGLSGWSHGHSLRSTGSPNSLASKLEISQSPTRTVLSSHRGPLGPSKLCAVLGLGPGGCQVPEEMNWPPASEPASEPANSPEPASQHPEEAPDAGTHSPPSPPDAAPASSEPYPVQCTEAPGTACPAPTGSENTSPDRKLRAGSVSPNPDRKSSQAPSADPPAPSAASSVPQSPSPWSSPESPSGAPLPSSAASPAPAPSEPQGQKFYNFVVLHTRADEQVALRVRQRLEDLGVADGATFCEDFQLPGRGELSCLQDALDHSAFTILLLTPNFNCRRSLYQLNQAVIGSLTRQGWRDSALPFLPLESSPDQLSPDTARLLAGLVWLEERSPVFAQRVSRTFRSQLLRERREHWRQEQEMRALREQCQQLQVEEQRARTWAAEYSAYIQRYMAFCQQMEQQQVELGKYTAWGARDPQTPPPAFPTWPGLQAPPRLPPPWPPGVPTPAFPQPPLFQPPSTFPPPSPQSPGVQPLIIQNAQMVQLGLNNHMWGQRGAPPLEDKTGQETE
ncbi:TIR domain-containing adapter molecule 1 [Sorex araneus]|uniref:TIR domain-containing adapter molecule 1 n=1 Tax=Sorex araneus TaxID=42254 RepID=UPI002433D2DC|nr:TIR domain-containing adapter molecule 1 [Sorex araneus]XP_054983221.1 TIR domain-containing adapter molecule 1 [Sorex araneus]XP_054983222.1 TIR domain-containing adapter molecule 1 [Sorex araneus]